SFMRVKHVAVNLESIAKYLVSPSHVIHRLFHRRNRRRKRAEVEPGRIEASYKWPVAGRSRRIIRQIDQSKVLGLGAYGAGIGGAIVIDATQTQSGDADVGIITDVGIIAQVTGTP